MKIPHRTYLEPRKSSNFGVAKYRAVCSDSKCAWKGQTTDFKEANWQAETHMKLQPLRDRGQI